MGKETQVCSRNAIHPAVTWNFFFRKPFKIKKTWTRNKPPASPLRSPPAQPSNYDDDDPPVYNVSPPRLRSPSPSPSQLISAEKSPIPPSTSTSVSNKNSTPIELRRIMEHVPSLRNSPIPASRRKSGSLREIDSTSSSKKVAAGLVAGQPKGSTVHMYSSASKILLTTRSTG